MLKPKPVHSSQMRRCSTAIIKRIIINDLKKGIGRLSEGEKANRKTTSRKLYGKISGKKSEFAVSISQGVIYFYPTTNKLRFSGGTRLRRSSGNQVEEKLIVIAGITGRGPLRPFMHPSVAKLNPHVNIDIIERNYLQAINENIS